jgi:class 3 adenylate cyclase
MRSDTSPIDIVGYPSPDRRTEGAPRPADENRAGGKEHASRLTNNSLGADRRRMALVFTTAEEPARCALRSPRGPQASEIPVRMGIHSGPVSEVADGSGRTNLAGPGSTWRSGDALEATPGTFFSPSMWRMIWCNTGNGAAGCTTWLECE